MPLLEGLSFAVRPGEALILRGPNGIGKTSLLRCAAGLLPPLAGRLEIVEGAAALAGHADGVKAQMSVRENLRFWAGVFGAPGGMDAVEAAMDAYAIAPLHERPARDLSAGQRRRLGLARLIVTGRPLWLLDEPTVSLDAAGTAAFGAALAAHVAGGGAALVSSHLPIEGRELDLGPHRAALPEPGW